METVVHQNPSVRILDYRCAAHRCGRGPEEESDAYQVVLPRDGFFIRHVRGETVVGDPNYALFFNHGESYRVSHPVEGGDRCTVLIFAVERIRDCLSHGYPGVLDTATRLFSRTHIATSPTVDLLHRHLLRQALQAAEPLLIEEISVRLLAGLLSDAADSDENRRPARCRSLTLQRHEELVLAARNHLSQRLGEKLDLHGIAAAVHTSPFHLSRVFRQLTGFSLSSYHRRLRLRTALQRILEGEADLTKLALDLGFANHSHFTDAFRREFGVSPSDNRDRLNAAVLRAACDPLPVGRRIVDRG